MTYFYAVFGLRLRANQPIAGLREIPESEDADLSVRLGATPEWFDRAHRDNYPVVRTGPYRTDGGTPSLVVRRVSEHAAYWYEYIDGTDFFVSVTGRDVWAVWPNTATLDDTLTYFLGPIIGFVLRLKGIPCLHAGAVVVRGKAIALLGAPGAGKSTTTAALGLRGYPVLSDDISALIERDDEWLVQPGPSRIRLWPESGSLVFGGMHLPRLTPTWDKRYVDATFAGYSFPSTGCPLGAMYLLAERSDEASAPHIATMAPRDQLIALVANAFGGSTLGGPARRDEFEFLSRLVRRVPIKIVTPHDNPSRLNALCDAILEDANMEIPAAAVAEIR